MSKKEKDEKRGVRREEEGGDRIGLRGQQIWLPEIAQGKQILAWEPNISPGPYATGYVPNCTLFHI